MPGIHKEEDCFSTTLALLNMPGQEKNSKQNQLDIIMRTIDAFGYSVDTKTIRDWLESARLGIPDRHYSQDILLMYVNVNP